MAELAVLGMGRFGRSVARFLTLEGQSVLAVDRDRARLDRVAEEVDSVSVADTTDEGALASLRLDRMSCVVVAMGSRALEASLLTTALLRGLDVPRLVARAFDERHARLLLAIGANEVINPEDEIGRRLALRLAHPDVVDQFRLGDSVVAQVEAPEVFAGRSLDDLDLPGEHALAVLAIHRGDRVIPRPGGDESVEGGDLLVVLGDPEAVRRVATLE